MFYNESGETLEKIAKVIESPSLDGDTTTSLDGDTKKLLR